jgi:hypothetical protein
MSMKKGLKLFRQLTFFMLITYIFIFCSKNNDINTIDNNDLADTTNVTDTNIIDTTTNIYYNYIIAGDTGFNVFYNVFSPPLRLEPTGELFYVWDSLDINNDRLYDLKFYIAGTSNDLTGFGYWASLYPINNNQIACSKINSLPDTLNLGDTIANELYWSDSASGILTYKKDQSEFQGNWTDIENKYLAFRLLNNDTTYGWLKMDVNYWGDLVIYEFATIKKNTNANSM